ncbi:cytochrome P450 [Mycena olivaceomarginata]|nr:cytochrome P450 [Mycena olivaceomarginata]
MKHIFGQVATYVKSPVLERVIVKFIGRGIVWAEGDEHKFQRKMVSPAFSISALRKMTPQVVAGVERLVIRLQNDCKSGAVVNMCDYTPATTLDITGTVALGYDFGPDSPEGSAILNAWKTDVARCSSFSGFLAPIMIGVAPWIASLPIKGLEDGIAKKIITKIGGSWQGKRKPNGERQLGHTTLIDNILSFFVAGFETTSGTINFILHDIARHPHFQTKLREEILAADSSEVAIVESLPYLDAVTREGLRLTPITRETHRVAMHDDVIPFKNPVTLRNGDTVTALPVKAGDGFIPFLILNTDPDVWGPDADQFIPERWLAAGGKASATEGLPRGPWGNVSNFADGPCHCIGWRLVVKETKLIVGALVKNFELRDTGAKVEKYVSPTVQPFVNGKAAYLPLELIPLQQ